MQFGFQKKTGNLFNLYGKWIFQDCIGIKVGGTRVNNMRQANDTVLIVEKE